MRFFRQGLPFRQIVRALLLDILLGVNALRTIKLLRDWVLDLNTLDHLVQSCERVAPEQVSTCSLLYPMQLTTLEVE